MTNPQPPGRTLTRKQLTAALILVTLIPFALVVVLYTTLPDFEDPVLEAAVSVGPRAWPNDSAEDARIVPCLILKNPTADVWRNVNMSVNEQFHFAHPSEIGGGEEIFVPLKFFHTKGNQFYPPESQELKLLTIYAQIPSGARAILEVAGADLASGLRLQDGPPKKVEPAEAKDEPAGAE
ncbi:hypothetical protein [Aureliella helgolandensis]|uniref:Uncharacterized protein n=1 Tax=Aureliella helgolandensis TaxID=2527968 RepID=A0A518GHM8_9BACT|nr:hypothetical protein [Aureliella helgolandensis]QDV28105.1 hypothetical protein Q31a_65000 [Aureliella helgolandensis]